MLVVKKVDLTYINKLIKRWHYYCLDIRSYGKWIKIGSKYFNKEDYVQKNIFDLTQTVEMINVKKEWI